MIDKVTLNLASLGALVDLVEALTNPKQELMPETGQAIGVLLKSTYDQLSESITQASEAK
jgi:hypothetical protein